MERQISVVLIKAPKSKDFIFGVKCPFILHCTLAAILMVKSDMYRSFNLKFCDTAVILSSRGSPVLCPLLSLPPEKAARVN